MYSCKECKEEFNKFYEKNLDAGGIYDRGAIRRFEVPKIKMCPSCYSTNITEVQR